jgi:hypothetical protein
MKKVEVPVLNQAPCHEDIWGSADVAPHIFKLGFPQLFLSKYIQMDDGSLDGEEPKRKLISLIKKKPEFWFYCTYTTF